MEGADLNLAAVNHAVAAAIPDREALAWGRRRLSYGELAGRARRFANHLLSRGFGACRPRRELAPWESGQDHLALYLHNGNAYLEAMIGAYYARVAPINVNYRYVTSELVDLLRMARARGLVYGGALAPRVAEVAAEVPGLELLVQVDDGSGHPLLPGAVDYEVALAAASDAVPFVEVSPDDLYVACTGGTTGAPKAVLWRQGDIFAAAMGGQVPDGKGRASLADAANRARAGGAGTWLVTSPLIHVTAQWTTFGAFHGGDRVVFPARTDRFDAADVLATAEAERVTMMVLVGDAFAGPLVTAMRRRRYDLSNLAAVATGGAPLQESLKRELLELLPDAVVIEGFGSSETGGQGYDVSGGGHAVSSRVYGLAPGAAVLSADRTRLLEPGDPEIGWVAQTGRIPLGYLDDRARTESTFPTIGGVRYSVPGDRARRLADGRVELLGRDSQTVNTGGEKVFVEEVEDALKRCAGVADAIVCGRPSERWGTEVVAVVSRDGDVSAEALRAACAEHLAGYKLPKAIVFVDAVQRHPSGKPDYRWAMEVAATAPP